MRPGSHRHRWETGLLAGLAHAGVDLTAADVVVGTSAGSVVGAQILGGGTIEDLYAEQLKDPAGEIAAKIGLRTLAWFVLGSIWPGDEQRLARRAWPQRHKNLVIWSSSADGAAHRA